MFPYIYVHESFSNIKIFQIFPSTVLFCKTDSRPRKDVSFWTDFGCRHQSSPQSIKVHTFVKYVLPRHIYLEVICEVSKGLSKKMLKCTCMWINYSAQTLLLGLLLTETSDQLFSCHVFLRVKTFHGVLIQIPIRCMNRKS